MRPTRKQVKAARMLLEMNQTELARAAGIAENTLVSFEAGHTMPHETTMQKIITALENRGISFSNGDTPTVKHDPSKAIIPT